MQQKDVQTPWEYSAYLGARCLGLNWPLSCLRLCPRPYRTGMQILPPYSAKDERVGPQLSNKDYLVAHLDLNRISIFCPQQFGEIRQWTWRWMRSQLLVLQTWFIFDLFFLPSSFSSSLLLVSTVHTLNGRKGDAAHGTGSLRRHIDTLPLNGVKIDGDGIWILFEEICACVKLT